jgi:2-oxoglutarate dehydrogenase E2 component (dihydrolipoamide succinyltransferase)
MSVEIKVPALGESVTEATVAQWFKKPGDAVTADEAVVELETDKVTVEVYAPVAGTLAEVLTNTGATVAVGALLGRINEGAAAGQASPATAGNGAAASASAPVAASPTASGAQHPAMPAARKLAADNGLDAAGLSGTGKDGRVTKGDVIEVLAQGAAQPAAPKQPAQQTQLAAPVLPSAAPASQTPYPFLTPAGPREERVRMSRLRLKIAERLKYAQSTAAMLTTFNEIDMTNVMAVRDRYKDVFEKKHGVKLGFLGFFVKAVIEALQDLPAVNAEIDGEDIVYKNYYDIGVAVGTEQGLVVPVVRDANRLSLSGVEKGIADLAKKARDGKLAIADMQGGTFTITNGGVYGSLMSTPIINPPQSGILGLHKIEKRPVVVASDKIEARPMMYVALSYDHRIVDGKEAVTFLVKVKEAIEDPQRILLGL